MANDPSISDLLNQYSSQYGVDPKLANSIAFHESGFNPSAVSPAGAKGVMQIMPSVANQYGVKDAFDPDQNIKAGVRQLAHLNSVFDNDPVKVSAAYNAGEGNVNKYGGVPPFPETQNYVQKVMNTYGNSQQGSQQNAPVGAAPFLPPPDFSLNGPSIADKLQQISGVVGALGGTAANIISAKRHIPGTGNQAFETGMNELNQSAQRMDTLSKQQQVMNYLKQPGINPNDASLAASYVRAGDMDKALGVLSASQQDTRGLVRSKDLAQYQLGLSFDKIQQMNAMKDQDFANYTDLNARQAAGETLSKQDQGTMERLGAQFDKAGYAIDPFQSSKAQPVIQKIGNQVSDATMLGQVASMVKDDLAKLPTGRFSGGALKLDDLVEQHPELKSLQLLQPILANKAAIAVAGASQRHNYQMNQKISDALSSTYNTPAEIQKTMSDLISTSKDAVQNATSGLSLLKGFNSSTYQEFQKRLQQGQYGGDLIANQVFPKIDQTQNSAASILKGRPAPVKGQSYEDYQRMIGVKK